MILKYINSRDIKLRILNINYKCHSMELFTNFKNKIKVSMKIIYL